DAGAVRRNPVQDTGRPHQGTKALSHWEWLDNSRCKWNTSLKVLRSYSAATI
ncbi:hypothetical protein NPIL_465481, partial [Nephila pilipes]